MANEFKGQAGHSAEYFGEARDHWWNLDFLRLMVERWTLGRVQTVLDVGCGVGHWGRLLGRVLPESVQVTGVDRDANWVEQATRRAVKSELADRFSYQRAEAERLPFADASFDLTTCQTLLIHLPKPEAGIAEMLRVTKPGGLVMAAEPNNLAGSLLLDSISSEASIEETLALVGLQLTCERGKIALGEGDNSLGGRVPGLFAAQGLTDIQVYVNDKASAVLPPYATEELRTLVEDARDRLARRVWTWSEPETRRFFLAGGGSEREFAVQFQRAMDISARYVRAMEDGTYHGVGGGTCYLIAGTKPH